MSAETRVERGIYRGANDHWRIYVRVAGRLVSRRFPPAWTLTRVRRARQDLAVKLRDAAERREAPDRPDPGTFAQDAALYLKTVRSMPTFKGRSHDIALWVEVFGPRRRETIRSIEIDAVLERWLADGYAGSTVKGRRTALMHLWSRLDGKGAPNPVKSSLRPREAEVEARDLPYSMIRLLLRLVPVTSKTRARLEVMAFTGLAPRQVAHIERTDIDLDKAVLWVRARKKGRGAKGFAKPLTDDGILALRRFAALEAFGPYSASSAYKTFQRAARGKLALGGLKPYDLRHSYITQLYDASGDIAATQAVAGHRSVTTTMRYAMRAVDTRATLAAAALGARLKLPDRVTGASR